MKNKIAFTIYFILSSFASLHANNNLQTLVKDNNNFGLALYKELKASQENIFFSPYSIYTAFAMTYAGAKHKTEIEMAQTLRFSLKEELHQPLSELQVKLDSANNEETVLKIANSLWAQKDYKFLDSFVALNKKYYGAGMHFVDYKKDSEKARQSINAWVEKKTNNKIKELLKPDKIDALTRLVLCNAIYFKGSWESKFDTKHTYEKDFHISKRKTRKCQMMQQTHKFRYKNFRNFSAIELPYKGNQLSMLIFLPKEIDGLAQLEKSLDEEHIGQWTKSLYETKKTKLSLSLPKFKTTYSVSLKKALSRMGMSIAFSDGADFSGMTGTIDLKISDAVHKTFVVIDEEGSEAAAATAVVMTLKMIKRDLEVKVNHPFLFFIRENQTGTILFMGRVIDPLK